MAGGLVFFLRTAVIVVVTVPGPAATAFVTRNPNAKASVPIISAIRLRFDFFIIVLTPLAYPRLLRCTIGRNAYMEGRFRVKSGQSVCYRQGWAAFCMKEGVPIA